VRRARQWGLTVSNGTITAATDAGSLLFDLGIGIEVALGQTLSNMTVGAIRLDIDFHAQSTAVIGDQYRMMWGIIIVSKDAFAVGATSIPDPTADHADWMAHGNVDLVADVAGSTSRPRFSHVEIRNDSMRKIRENNSKVILKVRGITIQDPVQVFVAGRVLFLLR